MTVDAFRHYTPRNRFRCTWTPNQKMDVSGGANLYTTTTYTTESYKVTIVYDGPVNIGDRNIIVQNIPNCWADYNVQYEARKKTSDESPCCPDEIECVDILCAGMKALYWILCCPCAYSSSEQESNAKYNRNLDIVAGLQMEKYLAKLLTDADNLVDERIAFAQRQQSVSTPQTMFNVEQMQALFQQLQLQQLQQQTSASVVAASPLATAYQTFGQPVRQPTETINLRSPLLGTRQ